VPETVESGPEGAEEEAFLRARRRVPVRRGILPKTQRGRILFAVISIAAVALSVVSGVAARNFFRNDPRFRINSASFIQSVGNSQVTRPELLSVFGSDIGRNVFFVPLGERRKQLEQLPWVGGATVMRLLPNQLRVSIVERVPVAFVRSGDTIKLVDAHGVLLNMTPAMMRGKHYSFPVVTGISARDPLSVRAARMHFYQEFISDLDSGGGKVSQQLSEVDISDPEDIRALLPAQGSDILVHFGDGSFLERYRRFEQNLAEWKRQYPHLASADMRYDNQVVLEMAKGTETPSGENSGERQTSKPMHASPAAPAQRAAKGKKAAVRASHRVIHRSER
jgi:cell division protein FtsQ